MQIKEIQTREEIFHTHHVMVQLYQELNSDNYIEDVLKMMQRGYKMVAVFDEENKCIGVMGLGITSKLHYGKVLEIEDFVIDREKNDSGADEMLLRWAELQASIFGCKNIVGILETKRQTAQRIFSREKFIIDGFFFRKKC